VDKLSAIGGLREQCHFHDTFPQPFNWSKTRHHAIIKVAKQCSNGWMMGKDNKSMQELEDEPMLLGLTLVSSYQRTSGTVIAHQLNSDGNFGNPLYQPCPPIKPGKCNLGPCAESPL
jgi:hypothetical protein